MTSERGCEREGLLIVCWALLCTLTAAQTAAAPKGAAAFCASPAAKAASCGWAGPAEYDATAGGVFTGTLWTAELSPPLNFTQARSYYQFGARVVSLGCRPGALAVRSVFRFRPGHRACSRLIIEQEHLGSVGRDPSGVTRCELQLLPGAGSGPAAALKAKEVNCKPCSKCTDCPLNKVGVWYADKATVSTGGCAAASKPGAPQYRPLTPAVLLNPGSDVQLAAFDVRPA